MDEQFNHQLLENDIERNQHDLFLQHLIQYIQFDDVREKSFQPINIFRI
jgi:hypothetical protein